MRLIFGVLAMSVAALVLFARPAISAAACANPIACENEKTGTPSTWRPATNIRCVDSHAEPLDWPVASSRRSAAACAWLP